MRSSSSKGIAAVGSWKNHQRLSSVHQPSGCSPTSWHACAAITHAYTTVPAYVVCRYRQHLAQQLKQHQLHQSSVNGISITHGWVSVGNRSNMLGNPLNPFNSSNLSFCSPVMCHCRGSSLCNEGTCTSGRKPWSRHGSRQG